MFDSTKKFDSSFRDNSYLSASFQSTKIVVARKYLSRHQSINQKEQSIINLERKQYNGEMSRATKAYLRKKLDAWFMSIRWNNKNEAGKGKRKIKKLVFFTCTLSATQTHTDYEVKRDVLNKFIVSGKSTGLFDKYFWRAEKQGNGNIHFHFISDCYIDKIKLQTAWNEAQEKLNYVTEFEKKIGHRNPPSTQIQIIPEGTNVIEYLFKYISKDKEQQAVAGRIWGMSDELRELLTPSEDMSNEMEKEISTFIEPTLKNLYQDENCMVVLIASENRLRYYSFLEKMATSEFYKANYEFLYEGKPTPTEIMHPIIPPPPLVIPQWLIDRRKKELDPKQQSLDF